jgi:hypothetical protein
MHIIDDLVAMRDAEQQLTPSARLHDPVLFLNEDGKPWTLWMVLSMWQWVFTQSRAEICKRGIPF